VRRSGRVGGAGVGLGVREESLGVLGWLAGWVAGCLLSMNI
jgi:hypothetical protein